MISVTRVAKAALEKALAENEDIESILASPEIPIVAEQPVDLHQPLIIKIDSAEDRHESWKSASFVNFSRPYFRSGQGFTYTSAFVHFIIDLYRAIFLEI